ncbi:hypothetical protein Glove_214g31 [Diversispora epigaea]|uniref:HAUS augmin-like complex subunit 4 n=1 Tax=Diversispora epigaea TaxID=1348612 RepID=A0A397IQY5_9GLOM|nr:hypothetical protein Glove_214g31 [Diversispora epigaea]
MPFHINKTLLSENPNFAEFYEQLFTHYLAPDGTTKELFLELNKDTHLEDKIFYCENLTLYNAIQQLTLEKEINENSDISGKTLETIKNLLSFAETKQYLNFRPQDISLKNCKLLGLTEEKLQQQQYELNKNKNESSLSQELNIKGILLNYIENKLKKLCEDIAKFYYVGEDSNPKLLFAKATKLDEKLNRRIEELRSFRISLVEDKNQLGEHITDYMNVMKNILLNLWNCIEEFKHCHEFKKNEVFCDYFSSVMKSIILKFRVLKLNALLSVYDQDTVEGLKNIRDNLLKEEENLIKELNEIEFELSKYQAAYEFDQIVQAYIEVNKEIERVRDDILRIENS